VGQCVQCYRERMIALKRAMRRVALRHAARRVGVVGCVALSGAAAVGAALLPETSPVLFSDPHTEIVARGEVRFVGDAVQRYTETHGASCPSSLGDLRREGYLLAAPVDPWGQPLLYGCVEGPRAFVVMSKGPDQTLGTLDDLVFASP
jgi:hypothetical protein